ncbi:hypothetical protein EYF80_064558 [Liparis tanakae]|uniref:Fibronectin type-III domain-containing protein n=1 Tax=Liparis tanakae TaxID=230148 RepID=A0A4Z2E9W1_9TELE|nr:hypothetical protein EYF80_064558 [Liparis tanakae]
METGEAGVTMETGEAGVTMETGHVVVPDLLQDSAYQVQVRHRSTRARNPLWSRWSEALTAPAELQHKPEVTMTTRLVNGSREVTLTWEVTRRFTVTMVTIVIKPVSRAAESGLRFILTDTQSSLGCPCKAECVTPGGRSQRTPGGRSQCTTFVSLAAVSLQLTASNKAGSSPPAELRLPAHRDEPTRGRRACVSVCVCVCVCVCV